MITAADLGRHAARVKIAGASYPAAPAPAPQPGSFAPIPASPPWPTSPTSGRIGHQDDVELANPKAPLVGTLFNPSESRLYGDPNLRGSAAKYVPQHEFPDAGRDRPGGEGQQMTDRTYRALLSKHYTDIRPFGLNLPPQLTMSALQTLPQQAFTLYPGDARHATYSAADSLYRDPAKAVQRQKYETALKEMREATFKHRTAKPFYYDEHATHEPSVVLTRPGAHAESASVMRMPSSAGWQDPPAGSMLRMLKSQYPSFNPDATRLHEHVHTTQSRAPADRKNDFDRNLFEHELPATLSENAHIADAYHTATGQYPAGTIMGMPYSEFVADLKRRQHLGGSTQMSTVMNDPKYRAQIQKMIEEQHGKFDQQDYLAPALDTALTSPRLLTAPLTAMSAGTPLYGTVQALSKNLPAGEWRNPKYRYDASGKNIGPISQP